MADWLLELKAGEYKGGYGEDGYLRLSDTGELHVYNTSEVYESSWDLTKDQALALANALVAWVGANHD